MMASEDRQVRNRLLATAVAIVLFCMSSTAIIASWAPGEIRYPTELIVMHDPG
ncbi:hypothetical protein BH11PSE11_BH11PSE11_17840 [soil metagenome]